MTAGPVTSRKSTPILLLELALPSAVLVWRVSCRPAAGLFSDWMVILSAYWIYTAVAGGRRGWPAVTAATMLGLLAVYAWRQVPCIVDTLRAVTW